MLSRKALAIASLSTIVCSGAGHAADGFKASEFLKFPQENQKGYISASAMMAGLIATQNVPDQAKCIDRWVADEATRGYPRIAEAMKAHGDYHPTAVIMSVLQKECGAVKYAR